MGYRFAEKCAVGDDPAPEEDCTADVRGERLIPFLDADDNFSSLPVLAFTANDPLLFPDTGKHNFKIIVVAYTAEETVPLQLAALSCVRCFPVPANDDSFRGLQYRFSVGISVTVPADKGQHRSAGFQERLYKRKMAIVLPAAFLTGDLF